MDGWIDRHRCVDDQTAVITHSVCISSFVKARPSEKLSVVWYLKLEVVTIFRNSYTTYSIASDVIFNACNVTTGSLKGGNVG